MNIVLASDDNYVQHLCVTIVSVMKSNSDVHFYIFTEGLSDSNKTILENLVKSMSCTINYCIVDSTIVSHFPMPKAGGEHISLATYYRLFADYLLPNSVDKFIYLDCDIVVRGSLDELWNLPITNYALGAVFQQIGSLTDSDFNRLGYSPEYGYFNAGVLLINLDYWRKNNVTARLFDFIKNHFSSIKQHDQDTLNAVLHAEVLPIDGKWNWLPLFYLFKNPQFPRNIKHSKPLNPVIVHYVSVPKPWEFGCDNPYTGEYYKYIKLTPFKNYRPEFKLSKVWKNYLIPKLVKIIVVIDFLNLRKAFK